MGLTSLFVLIYILIGLGVANSCEKEHKKVYGKGLSTSVYQAIIVMWVFSVIKFRVNKLRKKEEK